MLHTSREEGKKKRCYITTGRHRGRSPGQDPCRGLHRDRNPRRRDRSRDRHSFLGPCGPYDAFRRRQNPCPGRGWPPERPVRGSGPCGLPVGNRSSWPGVYSADRSFPFAWPGSCPCRGWGWSRGSRSSNRLVCISFRRVTVSFQVFSRRSFSLVFCSAVRFNWSNPPRQLGLFPRPNPGPAAKAKLDMAKRAPPTIHIFTLLLPNIEFFLLKFILGQVLFKVYSRFMPRSLILYNILNILNIFIIFGWWDLWRLDDFVEISIVFCGPFGRRLPEYSNLFLKFN